MDQVEDIDRDQKGDRLCEKDVNTQRVLEADVSAMLVGYNVGGSDRDDERSPPRLELISEYRQSHHSPTTSYPTTYAAPAPTHVRVHPHPPPPPPPHTIMDISSVLFQPLPVMAQAEMTSTCGHLWLNWPEMAKDNISLKGYSYDQYCKFTLLIKIIYMLLMNSKYFSHMCRI